MWKIYKSPFKSSAQTRNLKALLFWNFDLTWNWTKRGFDSFRNKETAFVYRKSKKISAYSKHTEVLSIKDLEEIFRLKKSSTVDQTETY